MTTETITRYVVRDGGGSVIAVTDEYSAGQGYGEPETLTVPAYADTLATLTDLAPGCRVTRTDTILVWAIYVPRYNEPGAHGLADRIEQATGWRTSVTSGGATVWVWPTVPPAISEED